MLVAPEIATAKPYLVRAMYEWCGEQGLTPYVSVFVDEQVQVPLEFVRDGEITLNVSLDATSGLLIDSETLAFKARFGGVPRQIIVPITHIMAIYGHENGQGMAFPIVDPTLLQQTVDQVTALPMQKPSELAAASPTMGKPKVKPTLTRIK